MTAATRILVVSDDLPLRQSLAELLATQGFAVAEAASAAEGLAQAAGQDLVVADERLPDGDGAGLCRALRADGCGAGLVLLGPAPNQRGGSGADEVVTKPFRLGALLATLKALAERRLAGRPLAVGPWRFERALRCLVGNGCQVRLTDKEAAILEHLHQAAGPVPREVLLAEVWGYGAGVDTHTLETHVYKLRRKLGDDLLVTEAGGYKLIHRRDAEGAEERRE